MKNGIAKYDLMVERIDAELLALFVMQEVR